MDTIEFLDYLDRHEASEDLAVGLVEVLALKGITLPGDDPADQPVADAPGRLVLVGAA